MTLVDYVSNVTKVCPGELITLICQTGHDQLLRWNVYVSYYNMTYSKLIANEGVNEMVSMQVDSMITLTFERISESGTLPLVSQLTINNAAGRLNGTMINCTEHSLDNIIQQRVIHTINTEANNSEHLTLIIIIIRESV